MMSNWDIKKTPLTLIGSVSSVFMPTRAVLSTELRLTESVDRPEFCGRLHRHASATTFKSTFRCNHITETIYQTGGSRLHCLGPRSTWIVVPKLGDSCASHWQMVRRSSGIRIRWLLRSLLYLYAHQGRHISSEWAWGAGLAY